MVRWRRLTVLVFLVLVGGLLSWPHAVSGQLYSWSQASRRLQWLPPKGYYGARMPLQMQYNWSSPVFAPFPVCRVERVTLIRPQQTKPIPFVPQMQSMAQVSARPIMMQPPVLPSFPLVTPRNYSLPCWPPLPMSPGLLSTPALPVRVTPPPYLPQLALQTHLVVALRFQSPPPPQLPRAVTAPRPRAPVGQRATTPAPVTSLPRMLARLPLLKAQPPPVASQPQVAPAPPGTLPQRPSTLHLPLLMLGEKKTLPGSEKAAQPPPAKSPSGRRMNIPELADVNLLALGHQEPPAPFGGSSWSPGSTPALLETLRGGATATVAVCEVLTQPVLPALPPTVLQHDHGASCREAEATSTLEPSAVSAVMLMEQTAQAPARAPSARVRAESDPLHPPTVLTR